MFLLFSGHHVGAHLDERQHSVSVQISINLGKMFHISHKKSCCVLNLGESLFIFPCFLFSDSGLNLLNGFDFILIVLNGVTPQTTN